MHVEDKTLWGGWLGGGGCGWQLVFALLRVLTVKSTTV